MKVTKVSWESKPPHKVTITFNNEATFSMFNMDVNNQIDFENALWMAQKILECAELVRRNREAIAPHLRKSIESLELAILAEKEGR